MYSAELAGPEAIIKSIKDGAFLYENLTNLMAQAHINADAKLDRVAAITMASQRTDVTPEVLRKNPEKFIDEEIEWLQDRARTEELLALTDAQMKKEGALLRVGERCPMKFSWLLNLMGMTEMTPDSLKQLLTSLLSKSLAMSIGDGNSTTVKPNGSSSAGSDATI
jgi:hypothetical protein